jgi:tetratricopeptide (TPR) repeat protein
MPLPALLAILALTLAAQPDRPEPDPPRRMTAAQIEAAGIEAVEAGDLEKAEAYFKAHAEQDPTTFTPWYNLAAVASLRGDTDAAEQHLAKALALGFSDIRVLRADPHLEALRATPFFGEIERRWPDLLAARRNADLAVAKQLVPRNAEARTLDRWKIELVSAHDEIATDQSEAELALIADWVTENLFTSLRPADAFEEDPWAMVVLPDRAEFARWAITVFGPGVRDGLSSVGGAYDHNRRRLVAQDLGATLRHELVHVLHWRDMSRLNQQHAAWIQEGLASLVEDYDLTDEDRTGGFTPVPSWRTNIVKRLNNARRLTPLEELAGTSMQRLTTSRPLAQYAQSRAVMLFLLDNGKLTEFYRLYTETYDRDPTGLHALRTALGHETQGDLEQAYQAWITSLPMVPETGTDLPATLGIEIENGDGDGVRVTGLPAGARQRTGLSVGSFITAINNRPTRDLHELIRVLADYAPGDTITLAHRRGRIHRTTEVTLQPR